VKSLLSLVTGLLKAENTVVQLNGRSCEKLVHQFQKLLKIVDLAKFWPNLKMFAVASALLAYQSSHQLVQTVSNSKLWKKSLKINAQFTLVKLQAKTAHPVIQTKSNLSEANAQLTNVAKLLPPQLQQLPPLQLPQQLTANTALTSKKSQEVSVTPGNTLWTHV
jgi:hypothetical protein